MFAAPGPMSRAQSDRFFLVSKLLADDPKGLETLLAMEGQIHRRKLREGQVTRALDRLRHGDERWIDEIRSSDEHELWTLLGMVICQAVGKSELLKESV